jgi:tetratricopeptide (TPR) repeat protein
MRRLKEISATAVPAALEKALRYRLLNEPLEAESICLDVLRVDPDNQEALVTMLLALTDLFADEYGAALSRAKAVLPRLTSDYDRAYFEGVIHERWAKAEKARHVPRHVTTGWYLQALHCFERATALAAPDNPDAILRWNACARVLAREGEAALTDSSLMRDLEAEFGEEAQTR